MTALTLIILQSCFIYFTSGLPTTGCPFDCRSATQSYDVIIVGAGTAGLSAAAELYKTHHIENFTVLEAKNRIGGRIFTMRDNFKAGEFIELGSEYVHGEVRNSFYQYAKSEGLIAPDQSGKSNEWFNMNGLAIPPSLVQEMDRVYRQLRREVEFDRDVKTSVGDALKEKFEKWLHSDHMDDAPTKRAIFYYFYMDECLDISDDLFNLSIDQDLNFVDASGNQELVAENGLLSVLEHLTADIPFNRNNSSSTLQLQTVVRKINWDVTCSDASAGKRVVIELADGRTISAKYAIVTLPLGVLKAESVKFNPELSPLKLSTIRRLGYGCVNKIFLIFQRAWWKKNSQVNVLFLNTIPDVVTLKRNLYDNFNSTWYQNMVAFSTVYGNPLALEVWLSGTWAKVVEKLPMDEIASVADQVLKRAFSSSFDVESPARVFKTNWCEDPFARGGYSYIAVDSFPIDLEILAKPLPDSTAESRVFFAGEATSTTQWSTVQGAWDTGKSAADKVASGLKYRKDSL